MKYRIQSSGMIYAPGIVNWAINGYAFEDDRPNILKILTSGWNIPDDVAHKLLSKQVPFIVEDETVVFEVS